MKRVNAGDRDHICDVKESRVTVKCCAEIYSMSGKMCTYPKIKFHGLHQCGDTFLATDVWCMIV